MPQLQLPMFRIAPELWVLVALFGVLSFTAYQSQQWFWFFFWGLMSLLSARYGYSAPRRAVGKAMGVFAPVDGTVCFRRESHDPYLGREAIRIGIRVAPLADYCLHSPVEGEVCALPGNPTQVSWVQTDEGEDIVVVVTRGWLFGAQPIALPAGERVGQGKRCGLRRAALAMDIYLPIHSRVEVVLQQVVKSGDTVIATLLRKSHG